MELFDVTVHPTCRGRTEGTRRVTLGSLGGPGVVHRVILHVLRHRFAGVEALLDLGVSDIASHNHRAAEHDACGDGVRRQLGEDVAHWAIQVDVNDLFFGQLFIVNIGKEARRVVFELLQEDAVLRDFTEGLAIG